MKYINLYILIDKSIFVKKYKLNILFLFNE